MSEWIAENWTAAGAVLGAGTLFAVAWKAWIWALCKAIGRGMKGTWHAYRQGRRIQRATWALIGDQLTANGGTSLTDKVNETNDIAKELSALFKEHIEADDRRFTALYLRLGIVPGDAERAFVEEHTGGEK